MESWVGILGKDSCSEEFPIKKSSVCKMPASLALTAELCGVLLPLQKGYLSIQNTSALVGKRTPFRGLNVIFGISKSEKGLCHFHICIFFFKIFLTEANANIVTKKYKAIGDD